MTRQSLEALEFRAFDVLMILIVLAGVLWAAAWWLNFIRKDASGRRLRVLAWLATLGAFLAALISFTARCFQPSPPQFAVNSMFGSALVFIVGVMGAVLVVNWRWKAEVIGAPSMLISGYLWSVASSSHRPVIDTLPPALQSFWMQIHVSMAILAYGPLMVSGVTGLIALIGYRLQALGLMEAGAGVPAAGGGELGIVASGNRESRLRALAASLPAPDAADTWTYKIIAFAFPWLTALIITGAIWANYAWGSYWQWDPKEVWALITWIIYAAYLHMRLVAGWRGPASSAFATIGAVSILFTYVGVNWLNDRFGLGALHAYTNSK